MKLNASSKERSPSVSFKQDIVIAYENKVSSVLYENLSFVAKEYRDDWRIRLDKKGNSFVVNDF